MLRKDGTLVTAENITDEDAKLSPWNVLELLTDDDEIKAFLEAALEEAPSDMAFYSRCLVKAAQARTINQLARETGADRQELCDMFLDRSEEDGPPKVSRDAIASLTKAFDVPLPVAAC